MPACFSLSSGIAEREYPRRDLERRGLRPLKIGDNRTEFHGGCYGPDDQIFYLHQQGKPGGSFGPNGSAVICAIFGSLQKRRSGVVATLATTLASGTQMPGAHPASTYRFKEQFTLQKHRSSVPLLSCRGKRRAAIGRCRERREEEGLAGEPPFFTGRMGNVGRTS